MVFKTLSSSIISLGSQYKIISEAEFTDEGTDAHRCERMFLRSIWEHRSTDVSWACVLSRLWTRLQLSSFGTLSGTSVGYTFCCTAGIHQRARCQCWKASVLAGESCLREQNVYDLVTGTFVFHQLVFFFFLSCGHLFFSFLLPTSLPRNTFWVLLALFFI